MTDKQIKQALKYAYKLPETENGKQFIQKHENRYFNFSGILGIELRYMGLGSAAALAVLLAVFLFAVRNADPERIWIAASFLPLCSLIPMVFLQRSKRFQMDEIEAASRFSIRFVRLIRMLILGVFSIVAVMLICLILPNDTGYKLAEILLYMFIPYLLNIWGGLLITRKWNRNESIFGVAAVSAICAFLPTLIKEIQNVAVLPLYIYFLVFICLLIITVTECVKYVNERLFLSWN